MPATRGNQLEAASKPETHGRSVNFNRLRLLWGQCVANGVRSWESDAEKLTALVKLNSRLQLSQEPFPKVQRADYRPVIASVLQDGLRTVEGIPGSGITVEHQAEKRAIRLVLRVLSTVGSHKGFSMAVGAKESTLYSYSDLARSNRPGRARLEQAAEYLELQSQTLQDLAAMVRGVAASAQPSASNRTDSTPALLLEPDLDHENAHD